MAHAKQVFESPDLIRLIYSFGDPTHRTFTSKLKFLLKPMPDNFEYLYYERALLEEDYYPMDEYLSTYTVREIDDYLKEFERCFCCSRHSIRKPRLKYRTSPQSVFENTPTQCDCCCRWLTRVMVRHLKYRLYEPGGYL